jgi:hypothetical protein
VLKTDHTCKGTADEKTGSRYIILLGYAWFTRCHFTCCGLRFCTPFSGGCNALPSRYGAAPSVTRKHPGPPATCAYLARLLQSSLTARRMSRQSKAACEPETSRPDPLDRQRRAEPAAERADGYSRRPVRRRQAK